MPGSPSTLLPVTSLNLTICCLSQFKEDRDEHSVSDHEINPLTYIYYRQMTDSGFDPRSCRCSAVLPLLYEVPYGGGGTASTLGSWTALTADEVEQLIASAPNKTCQLDSVPTWLVKDLSGTFHRRAIQQITCYRLLPICVQAGSCPSAFEEEWTGCK